MMTAEWDFIDFLEHVKPIEQPGETFWTSIDHLEAQAYQAETEAIRDALNSGSRVRLEAVIPPLSKNAETDLALLRRFERSDNKKIRPSGMSLVRATEIAMQVAEKEESCES